MAVGELKEAKKKFKRLYKQSKVEKDLISVATLRLLRDFGRGIIINYPEAKGLEKIEKRIKKLEHRIKEMQSI